MNGVGVVDSMTIILGDSNAGAAAIRKSKVVKWCHNKKSPCFAKLGDIIILRVLLVPIVVLT